MKIFSRFSSFLPIFIISVRVTAIWCKNVPFPNQDYQEDLFELNSGQNHDENDQDESGPTRATKRAPDPVSASSRKRNLSKQRRQVFREDLSPKLGGKIPSGALEWTRLMFNHLDSRGISVPDGWIPSTNDRLSSDESRIRYFRDPNQSVPNIETTYTFPISLSMIGGLDAGGEGENTGGGTGDGYGTGIGTGTRYNNGDKSEEEKRKSNVMFSSDRDEIGIGDWDARGKPKTKKMKKISDNVLHTALKPSNSGTGSDSSFDSDSGRDRDRGSQYLQNQNEHQHQTRQYQRTPHKVELHFFSPKDMENLETRYRDQVIDDIISRLKSSTDIGTGTGSGNSTSQNKRTGGKSKSNKNGSQTRTRTRSRAPSLLSTTFSRMTQGNGRL